MVTIITNTIIVIMEQFWRLSFGLRHELDAYTVRNIDINVTVKGSTKEEALINGAKLVTNKFKLNDDEISSFELEEFIDNGTDQSVFVDLFFTQNIPLDVTKYYDAMGDIDVDRDVFIDHYSKLIEIMRPKSRRYERHVLALHELESKNGHTPTIKVYKMLTIYIKENFDKWIIKNAKCELLEESIVINSNV